MLERLRADWMTSLSVIIEKMPPASDSMPTVNQTNEGSWSSYCAQEKSEPLYDFFGVQSGRRSTTSCLIFLRQWRPLSAFTVEDTKGLKCTCRWHLLEAYREPDGCQTDCERWSKWGPGIAHISFRRITDWAWTGCQVSPSMRSSLGISLLQRELWGLSCMTRSSDQCFKAKS